MPGPYLLPSRIRIPEREKIAYIAGIFDGEGCISTVSYYTATNIHRWGFHLEITNTCEQVIRYIHGVLNCGTVSSQERKDKPNWNVAWRFQLSAVNDLLPLLQSIHPYLIIKRERVEEVIRELEELKARKDSEKRPRGHVSEKQKIWSRNWREKHTKA